MQSTETAISDAEKVRPITADASAAFIREASERQIRAHAHRLVAGRRDQIHTMTVEQRRAELLSLAEKVANGELHADELAAASLPHLTDVANVDAEFEQLVDAVIVRQRFVADPDEWLARHDFPLSAAVFDAQDEATQAQVDQCLDSMCAVRS